MPLKYGEHWVTLSNGSRVLLDKDGQVVAGFRAFIGKNISECGPSVLELHKYSGVKKTFADCLKDAKGKKRYEKAAKDYFDTNLKNTFVETALQNGKKIDIHFTGKTWGKISMDMRNDPLKAELVRFMPVVLQQRFHVKSRSNNKPRNDFDGFHYFKAIVRTKDETGKAVVVRMRIDVGVRANSKDDFEAYHMSYDSKKRSLALDVNCRDISITGTHTQSGVVSQRRNFDTFARLAEDNINDFCEVVNLEIEEVVALAEDNAYFHPAYQLAVLRVELAINALLNAIKKCTGGKA